RKLGGIRFGIGFPAMLIVMVFLCKTKGALVLLFGGIFVLWASTRLRTRLLLGALALFGPIYAGVRIPNLWSGQQAVRLASLLFGKERTASLQYRLDNEEVMIAKALERPILGWGGWNRFNVYGLRDESGVFHAETENLVHHVPFDGMWLVIFGYKGCVGL